MDTAVHLAPLWHQEKVSTVLSKIEEEPIHLHLEQVFTAASLQVLPKPDLLNIVKQ